MALTRPKAHQINFDVTNITDPLVRLNSGESGTPDKDVGIVIERGSSTNAAIIYDESADEFAIINTTEDGTTSGNVTIASYANVQFAAATIGGHVLPTADNTYDLGSTSYRWRDLYVGPGSLYVNNKKVLEDDSGTITLATTADQSLTVKTTGSGVTTVQSAGGVAITASSSADVTLTTSSGNIELKGNVEVLTGKKISDSASTAVVFGDSILLDAGSNLVFEGSAENAYETTLTVTNPDADRTITFPNSSGTVALTSDISGGTLTIAADSGSNDNVTVGTNTLTFAGGTGIDTTVSDNQISTAIDSTVATLTGSQTLTNKTLTSPTIAGGTATGNVTFNDSIELRLGTDADANIKHTGTNLNINETTGDINIRTYADNADVFIISDDGSGGTANYFKADGSSGESKLYYYGTEIFASTTSGIQIANTSASAGANIKFLEGSNNGSNAVTLQGPASTADVTVTLPSATDTLVGKATTDTLTNKTISGSSNTLSNIGNSSLSNSTITVARVGGNSTAIALGGTISFAATANETTVAESSGTITIGLPPDVTIGGVLTVSGNLVVNGTTTTVSSSNTVIEDTLIELNTGAGSNANDMGLIMERGSTGDNAIFMWDESADKFTLGTTTAVASATGNISVSTGTLVANLEGNVTGTIQTASQTSITAVGTLNGLAIAGSQTITMGSNRVTNVTDPTSAQDAATKAYVDSQTSAGGLALTSLDIDGASDIGAALADADLFIVDDGAGGTNRKTAASRIKTYVGASAGAFSIANLDVDGASDIGAALADADLFIVDDGAGGTNRKTAASRIKTYVADVTLTTAAQTNITSVGSLNGITIASSQTVSMGSNRVTNVADPVGSQDAVTKAYFEANASSGGSGAGFTNSTITTMPGSSADHDLAKVNAQTGSVETPFEAAGTDAFGVNLGEIYDMMEPIGSTSSVDLGVLS